MGKIIQKKKHITTVRSETERARDHNQPECRPLDKAMDVQQLQTLPGISRWIATGRFVAFKKIYERI